jgi:hypothetical protein
MTASSHNHNQVDVLYFTMRPRNVGRAWQREGYSIVGQKDAEKADGNPGKSVQRYRCGSATRDSPVFSMYCRGDADHSAVACRE